MVGSPVAPGRSSGGEKSAAGVDEERDAPGLAEPGELLHRRLLGEAHQREVRPVHLRHQRRRRRERPLEVRPSGAVRGPHLHERGVGLAHHVRDPEAAADLHQLPTGHHHLPALGERGKNQERRRGAVVHHDGVLGAGQRPERLEERREARSPFS